MAIDPKVAAAAAQAAATAAQAAAEAAAAEATMAAETDEVRTTAPTLADSGIRKILEDTEATGAGEGQLDATSMSSVLDADARDLLLQGREGLAGLPGISSIETATGQVGSVSAGSMFGPNFQSQQSPGFGGSDMISTVFRVNMDNDDAELVPSYGGQELGPMTEEWSEVRDRMDAVLDAADADSGDPDSGDPDSADPDSKGDDDDDGMAVSADVTFTVGLSDWTLPGAIINAVAAVADAIDDTDDDEDPPESADATPDAAPVPSGGDGTTPSGEQAPNPLPPGVGTPAGDPDDPTSGTGTKPLPDWSGLLPGNLGSVLTGVTGHTGPTGQNPLGPQGGGTTVNPGTEGGSTAPSGVFVLPTADVYINVTDPPKPEGELSQVDPGVLEVLPPSADPDAINPGDPMAAASSMQASTAYSPIYGSEPSNTADDDVGEDIGTTGETPSVNDILPSELDDPFAAMAPADDSSGSSADHGRDFGRSHGKGDGQDHGRGHDDEDTPLE